MREYYEIIQLSSWMIRPNEENEISENVVEWFYVELEASLKPNYIS